MHLLFKIYNPEVHSHMYLIGILFFLFVSIYKRGNRNLSPHAPPYSLQNSSVVLSSQDAKLFHPQKCSSPWLTRNVNNIMCIRETIETRSTALGVRAHVLKVQPITHIKRMLKADALGDAINAIACWAPDTIFCGVCIAALLSGKRVEVEA